MPPRAVEALTAREHGRAVGDRSADRVEHPLEARLADDRLRWKRARLLDQPLAERVVDVVEHDDPARRGAALAGVREGGGDRPAHGVPEIGVVADDERVLAAELEADLCEPSPGGLVDPATGRGGAGEADEVDVLVLDERSARLRPGALDDVEHAVGQAGLARELAEEPGRRGRVLRRLDDRCVAAENRWKCLPGDIRERRVEAHDQPGDAERLAEREHGAVSHARGRRAPVGASALAGHEHAHLDRRVGLAAGELDRLPRLLGDELGRLLAPVLQPERQLSDRVASLDRGSLGPGGLRGASRGDRGVDVLRAGARDAAEQRPVGGAELVEPAPGRGGPRLAADEVRDLVRDQRLTRPTSRRPRRGWRR